MQRMVLLLVLVLASYCHCLWGEDFRIDSIPSGATVEIDGNTVGKTPYVTKLPGGYFHKTATVFGARLEHPMHAHLSLQGYVSQDVELTVGPMRWVALNGTDHGAYFLLKDKTVSVTFVPEAKNFSATSIQVSPLRQLEISSTELPLDALVEETTPAVLRLSTADGIGSGFLVTKTGVIATNAHVVGNAKEVVITNTEQQRFNGKVIYRDTQLDLALVKLDVEGTPSLPFASNERVGQTVIAIGNPGLGMQNTVTRGIIGGIGPYPDLGPGTWIQTDASINPGNSGGPLLNSRGEVVGMNTLKVVKSGFQGIGFALSGQSILEAIQKFAPPEKREVAAKGKVEITSSVLSAELFIDGKYVGNPPSVVPLTQGDHTIEVKASKFVDWKRTVSVSDGSELEVRAVMQPQ